MISRGHDSNQMARAEWRRQNATLRIARFDDVKNEPDPPVSGTLAERFGLAWELTLAACELGGKYNAQQPLQRHVARFVEPEC